MKKIQSINFWGGLFLSLVAFILGGTGDVAMAAAALADGGMQTSGNGNIGEDSTGAPVAQQTDGIATETGGRADGDDDFYLNDVDRKIVKIRPMSTPVDQISRYASTSHTDSFICKYYSVGTRPIKTAIASNGQSALSSGTQIALNVDDPSIFTIDDTLRVVNVHASNYQKEDGSVTAYSGNNVPDLMLVVSGFDASGNPCVHAVNGTQIGGTGQPIGFAAIAGGTTIVRMGKACGELDAQTGRFESTPTAEVQYCQNFMMQVEQSFLDKIAAKEANWGFSDLEEDAIYDMRLTQEESFLFGDLGYIKHNSKSNMAQWFTKGLWWMPSKTLEVGSAKAVQLDEKSLYTDQYGNIAFADGTRYNAATPTAAYWDGTNNDKIYATSGSGHTTAVTLTIKAVTETEITDDDLIDLAKSIFVGAGTGNKRKVVLCGSDLMAAFGKIKSDKFKLVSTFEKWHLKFTSWETSFGTLNLIHHELFDMNDMHGYGLVLDPEYLKKRKHLDWTRTLLDLKKAGVRNTQAAVLQEISCLYLRYPNAHARLKLKGWTKA